MARVAAAAEPFFDEIGWGVAGAGGETAGLLAGDVGAALDEGAAGFSGEEDGAAGGGEVDSGDGAGTGAVLER